MANYTKATNFTVKDTTRDIILGAEHDTEYTAIQTSIATKADLANPIFTGTVIVPTPAATSDTTVAASTAYVRDILPAGVVVPYAGGVPPENWLLCDGSAVNRVTFAALFSVISVVFGVGDGSTTFNLPDLRSRTPIGAGTGTLAEGVGAADVSTVNDTFTVVSNVDTWVTGMAVVVTSSGTLPTTNPANGFLGTVYVIRASATTIKFASSLANAVDGTVIDITDIGSGTHTVTHTLTARTIGNKLGEESHANTVAELPAHNHGGATGSTNAQLANSTTQLQYVDTASGYGTSSSSPASGHTHTIPSQGSSAAHNNMQPSLVLNYIIKT